MERFIAYDLKVWSDKTNRKPLIIKGARQIGKSWSVRKLGQTRYKNNYVELNFEKKPLLCQIFEQDLDAKRILREIEILENVRINDNTLIFLDEIQQCPKALMALRYFYEDLPFQPVIAAGSLLDFQLKDIVFPVGRVEVVDMFPMSFEEFLMARNLKSLLPFLKADESSFNTLMEQKIYSELLNYYWVGGMPACVYEFVNSGNHQEVRKIQEDLLYTFQMDFGKYSPKVNPDCLRDVWNSVSQNIGSQIIYSKLSERFSIPTIKSAFEVLNTARIFHRLSNVSVESLPFLVSNRQHKALFLDIGLLLCLSKVSYQSLFFSKNLSSHFTGPWAEQFVGQQLMAHGHFPLYYWARTERNSSAEVDFVIEKEGEIIPVEVKSGKSGKLRSLHLMLQSYPHLKQAYVLNRGPFGNENQLLFRPIYSVGNL